MEGRRSPERLVGATLQSGEPGLWCNIEPHWHAFYSKNRAKMAKLVVMISRAFHPSAVEQR